MGFKAIYKDKSSLTKFGILFLLIFTSLILHNILAFIFIFLFSDNGINLIQHQDLTNQVHVNYLKFMQLFNSIGFFVTPMFLYAYFTGFDFKFASIKRQDFILVVAIMMLTPPFVSLLLEWNMKIVLPEWVLYFETNSEPIIEAFLKMNNVWDLLYTLLVIAIVPALGEELLFRGYIQQKIVKYLKNPHLAILITAFLFGLIHLDFQAIIPRFFLGIVLGYLFFWSDSLWLPILAHFVNNAQAVIFSYPLFEVKNGAYSIFSKTKIDPSMALFSLASVCLLLYILHKNLCVKKD